MININEVEYHLGLVGYKLRHSVSPAIHRAALAEFGLRGDYDLFSVPSFPEGEPVLKEIIRKVRAKEIHGINVTIPYKQTVLLYVDALTEVAREVQAVNTIYLLDGKLYGDNTDVEGFIRDIQRYQARFQRAVVLGAGGAARAAVHGLIQNGCHVTICSRRFEQAQQLAADMNLLSDRFSARINAIEYTRDGLLTAVDDCDLIVNATPCGMYPNVDTSIWIEGVPFPTGALVYDMVYNPPETTLIRSAKFNNVEAVSGLGMLVYQAMLAFQRWTGKMPSYDRLYIVAKEQLERMFQIEEKS